MKLWFIFYNAVAPLVHTGRSTSSGWLQMAWHLTGAMPSTTTMLTRMWLECDIDQVTQHAYRVKAITWSFMMTSSNGNIFRVTGPLCGEFTGPGERPVTRSFGVFFDLRLNEPLSKQSWGWWFETLSRSLWRHRNDINKVDGEMERSATRWFLWYWRFVSSGWQPSMQWSPLKHGQLSLDHFLHSSHRLSRCRCLWDFKIWVMLLECNYFVTSIIIT